MNAKENKSVSNGIENATSPSVIKPGEASLAASFSCLHPSINGVEALMRTELTWSPAVSTQLHHKYCLFPLHFPECSLGHCYTSRETILRDHSQKSKVLCLGQFSTTRLHRRSVRDFPPGERLVGLHPLPSKQFKRLFLVLFAIDFFGCIAGKWLIDGFGKQVSAGNEAIATLPKSATDAEEALLVEESKANQALLVAMFLLLLTTIGTSAF
jgi:hypothetical protein